MCLACLIGYSSLRYSTFSLIRFIALSSALDMRLFADVSLVQSLSLLSLVLDIRFWRSWLG